MLRWKVRHPQRSGGALLAARRDQPCPLLLAAASCYKHAV